MEKRKVKFGDIIINQESKDLIVSCLESNHVTIGPRVKELEQLWSELMSTNNTVLMNSGTSACAAACMTLYERGAKPGMEVIVPALSFIASATAIRAAGFEPRFVDVDYDMNINIDKISNAINTDTAAIMGVNLMGKPCNIVRLREIADHYKLPVIIDNCEGHGCKVDNEYMEYYADMVTYSFYTAHVLMSGEMGAVCTKHDGLAEILKSIRNHGRTNHPYNFEHVRYGLNFKPTDLHACIGLGNITHFNEIFNKRKENFYFLKNKLDKYNDRFYFTEEKENEINSPHAFSMTFKHGFNEIQYFKKWLTWWGIEWKRNFGSIPTHGAFQYKEQDYYPIAQHIGNNGLHIGVHQYLTQEDLDYMVWVIEEFINAN